MLIKKRNAFTYISLLILELIAFPFFLSAQQKISKPVTINLPKIDGFIENIGQLSGQDQSSLNQIKFYSLQGNTSIYATASKLSFVFSKKTQDSSNKSETGILRKSRSKIEASRIEMCFLGANPKSEILTKDQSKGYINSFRNKRSAGISGARVFKKIIYLNIYPKIDLVLIYQDNGLRYEFVVKPGGKISDIRIKWNGTNRIQNRKNGGFFYQNSLGMITEEAPQSYTNDGNKVGSKSIIEGNEIRFETNKYDISKTLTIDPTLTWATEYGDNVSACNVATDTEGNVCVAYLTESVNGIASSGAYQTTFTGNDAPFIVKFDSSGKLLWATYFGGTLPGVSEDNYGCNIATDKTGNIFIAGSTMDTVGIATSGGWQTKNAGGWDAFLAKFDPKGYLIWSTYYGGPGGEYALGMKTGSNGDAFLAGWTFSTTGIATKGAFQTINDGNGEAFVADFSTQGKLKWATYFGGTAQNQGMCVALDNNNNIALAGLTSSTGIATSGAYQTSYNGGSGDAFLVKFDSTGSRKWATYFGGSAYDYAIGLTADRSGNIFMTGYTNSFKGIATSGAHQTKLGGSANAFLAKFSGSGMLDWSTYYGGTNLTEGTNLVTDSCGFAYMTGFTGSDTGIATSGSYQSIETSFNSHAFLSKFSPNGALVFGTYYEGNVAETGYGIALDNEKNIYISGQTTSSSGLATSGGYQSTYGGNGDVYLAKFRQIPPYISPGKPQTIHCPGDSAMLGGVPLNKAQYNWTGNPPGFTSNSPNPIVKPKISTTYYLSVYPYNDCPIYDSVFVTVNKFSSINPARSRGICPGDSINLGGTGVNGYTYSWTSNPTGLHSSSPDPSVSPTDSTYYFLTETNNTTDCVLKDTEYVFFNPIPKPIIQGDTGTCGISHIITYSVAYNSGAKYNWFANGGKVIFGQSNYSAGINVNRYGVDTISLVETSSRGCIGSTKLYVTAYTLPTAGLIYKKEACQFENISFKDSSTMTVSETIDFGDGTPIRILPGPFFGLNHIYSKPGKYILTQVVYAGDGCPGGSYYQITIDSVPALNWIVKNDTGRSIIFNENDSNYTSYTWKFGDQDSTHSKKGIYSYKRNGECDLSLLVTSSKGCSVFFDSTLRINLLYLLNSVWAYPNPFSDELEVGYTLSDDAHITAELDDAIGRKLSNLFDEQQSNGKYNVTLGAIVQTLPPAIYFVEVVINKQVYSEKVVKAQ